MIFQKLLREHWQMPIIFVMAVFQGYHYGIGDLSTYIPFVWHYFDPAYFADDLLIKTLEDHPVYIWHFLALFLHVMDIQVLFMGLFLGQIAFLIWAYRYFYETFFPGNKGWILLLLVLVVPVFAAAMGRYGLNPYLYFHPGALAFGCLLIGYSLIDRGQWLKGAALLGFIFLFHPFTALYAALMLGFRILLDFKVLPFKTIILSCLVFLGISSPTWLGHLTHLLDSSSASFDQALWLELVQFRMKFSFFLSQWVPDRYIHLGLAAIGILAFYRHPAFRRLLPALLTVATALFVMGIAELFSIKFILQLQLARNSFLLFVVLAAFVISHIWQLPPGQLRGPGALWLLIPFVLMLQGAVGDKNNPLRWVLLAIALGSILYLIWRAKPEWQKRYLAVAWLLVVLMTSTTVVDRYTATNRVFDITGVSAWERLQEWCKENLPPGVTVMTPPEKEGFRSLSLRPIYGSYKDGAPHNYSKKTIFEWWQRMGELGVKIPFKREHLPGLYRENGAEVAEKAGIRFLVYQKRPKIIWENSIFENDVYGVADLQKKEEAKN